MRFDNRVRTALAAIAVFKQVRAAEGIYALQDAPAVESGNYSTTHLPL